MNRTTRYHRWPRNLGLADKLPEIVTLASKRGLAVSEGAGSFHLTVNRFESAYSESLVEYMEALGKTVDYESTRCVVKFCDDNRKNWLTVRLDVEFSGDGIGVDIDSSNDDMGVAAHNLVRELLQLSNPPPPKAEAARPKGLRDSIFLGKHFDQDAAKPSATLRSFISLLRFDVVEAEEYRAITIPEKVKQLINRQDIYLGLVTGKREHDWITAEANFALGSGKHVILIIEEGTGFNPTLQGKDLEHIPFKSGFIEGAFIKLLQEFNSLGILGH